MRLLKEVQPLGVIGYSLFPAVRFAVQNDACFSLQHLIRQRCGSMLRNVLASVSSKSQSEDLPACCIWIQLGFLVRLVRSWCCQEDWADPVDISVVLIRYKQVICRAVL
jgi:hypothetical protein